MTSVLNILHLYTYIEHKYSLYVSKRFETEIQRRIEIVNDACQKNKHCIKRQNNLVRSKEMCTALLCHIRPSVNAG